MLRHFLDDFMSFVPQDERPDRRGRQGKPYHRDYLRFVGADVRRPVSRSETPRRERQLQVQKESGRRVVGFHVKQPLCETRYTAKWFSVSTRTARG